MSLQAYLDDAETKTGVTPAEFVELAALRGYGKDTEAGEIVAWLKDDHGLGRGHAMALVHVIENGARVGDEHVDSDGTHSDPADELRLDGIANR